MFNNSFTSTCTQTGWAKWSFAKPRNNAWALILEIINLGIILGFKLGIILDFNIGNFDGLPELIKSGSNRGAWISLISLSRRTNLLKFLLGHQFAASFGLWIERILIGLLIWIFIGLLIFYLGRLIFWFFLLLSICIFFGLLILIITEFLRPSYISLSHFDSIYCLGFWL